MQQVRIKRRPRTARRREARFDVLPTDPRDPDIARAKALQRDGESAARRPR